MINSSSTSSLKLTSLESVTLLERLSKQSRALALLRSLYLARSNARSRRRAGR